MGFIKPDIHMEYKKVNNHTVLQQGCLCPRTKRNFIPIILIIMLGYYALEYGNEQHFMVTVNKTERTTEESSSYYLVFTDKGVFQISDQVFKWKFNSSDIYGSIKADSTYEIITTGYRVPFLSMYPNIIKVTPKYNNDEKLINTQDKEHMGSD